MSPTFKQREPMPSPPRRHYASWFLGWEIVVMKALREYSRQRAKLLAAPWRRQLVDEIRWTLSYYMHPSWDIESCGSSSTDRLSDDSAYFEAARPDHWAGSAGWHWRQEMDRMDAMAWDFNRKAKTWSEWWSDGS